MTTTIDRMAEAASKAVTISVNRSYGQHIRAMRETRALDALTSSDIHDLAMRLTDAGESKSYVDNITLRICTQAGVPFPPTRG